MHLRKHFRALLPGWTLALLAWIAVPAQAATNHTITQSGFSFSPNALNIAYGDTVTWVWTGGAHTVTSGTDPSDPNAAALFCVNLGTTVVSSHCSNTATVFQYVFTTVGMTPFHCEPHYFFGMTGTVNVAPPVDPPKPVHVVTVRDFEFDPAILVAAPGDTVRWVWESGSHTTTSGASSNPVHNPGALWDAIIDEAHPSFDFVIPGDGNKGVLGAAGAGLYPYFSIPDELLGMTGSVAADSTAVTGVPDMGMGPGLHADPPFPNPTAGSSTVMFSLDAPSHVRVQVFDITGRLVRTLADEEMGEGFHSARWEGETQSGSGVGNGVFFVRVQAGDQAAVHKVFRNETLADMGHHHH